MQVLHWRQISSLRHRCYGVSMVHWRQIELLDTNFKFFSQKFLTDVIVTMVLLGGVLHTSTQLLMRFASVPTPSKYRKRRENERNGRSMADYFHGGSMSMSSFWLWRSHSVWLLGLLWTHWSYAALPIALLLRSIVGCRGPLCSDVLGCCCHFRGHTVWLRVVVVVCLLLRVARCSFEVASFV